MSAVTGEILVPFMGLLVFCNRPFVMYTTPVYSDYCFDAHAFAKQMHPPRSGANMCMEDI